MFIKLVKVPKQEEHLVYLVEGYRDRNGLVKHRTLHAYGRLSELLAGDPDAVERLRTWAQAETAKGEQGKHEMVFLHLGEEHDGTQQLVNIGYVFLAAIYQALKIPEFILGYRTKTQIAYPLDDILQLLVYSRCLNPGSKKKTYEGKGNYFFELPDFTLDDVYRSLSHLAAMKEKLTLHLHRRITEMRGRDCSLVFYDVTNYYFSTERGEGLRQTGVSKENQETDIVQLGLFIDNDGIPITYELFPGNTNDMATMRPILQKIKKDYGLGKITIVADKGNNTGENLAYIDGEDDHYIISQKIRGAGKDLIAAVLDEDGYVWNQDGTFKSKSIERERVVKRSDMSTRTITEHLLCFWSRNEQDYQRAKRGFLDEKIAEFIENPSLLNASNAFGIKKYFKKVLVDQETGEILKAKEHYVFNQAKYERDLALDGYYCIVTNDLTLAPLEIIQHYHQLSKIEESFKVTKSDLEGRPVYVWTRDHIEGHFLTCYLALVLYRLLQIKLDNRYPIHQLKEALNSAEAVLLDSGIYLIPDPLPIVNELAEKHQAKLNYKRMKLEYLRSQLNRIKRHS